MPEIHTTTSMKFPWIDSEGPAALPATVRISGFQEDSPQVRTAYPYGWAHRAEADVQSSWLRQITLVEISGFTVRFQARLSVNAFAGIRGDQFEDRSVPEWPLSRPVFIFGSVRTPAPTKLTEATATRNNIIERLEPKGIGTLRARSIDRFHRWIEPSVLAFPFVDVEEPVDVWRGHVLSTAQQVGIDTVVEVVDSQWKVLSMKWGPSYRFTETARGIASLTRDGEPRCPMQAVPEVGEYCRMYGGPWTSRSIAAAAAWREHRSRLVEAAGCATCEGVRYLFQDKVFSGGGPITRQEIPISTRWLEATKSTVERTP